MKNGYIKNIYLIILILNHLKMNLFPFLTQVAIGRRSHLKVFGDDWETKDGSGVRDYIHIIDLAEGHLSSIDYLNSNDSCLEFINLGSGLGYSVFQIISQFELSTGCQIPYSIQYQPNLYLVS